MDQGGDPSSYPSSGNWLFEESGVRAMCWHSTERGTTSFNIRKCFKSKKQNLLYIQYITFCLYTCKVLFYTDTRYKLCELAVTPESVEWSSKRAGEAYDPRQHVEDITFYCLIK
jgi:hypothetical protein